MNRLATRTLSRVARLGAALLLVFSAAVSVASAPLPSVDLELTLDPDTRSMAATATLRGQARDFRFVLHRSLAVNAASVAGKAVRVTQSGTEGPWVEWRVMTTASGDLRLQYSGILPALEPGLDHRAVLRQLEPMSSPAGSFLPASGAWYPRPGPLFTYRVALSVPGSQRALVAGRLQTESTPADGDDRYRAAFEFSQVADGIDLMAGPWAVREHLLPRTDAQPLRLRTYFPAALDAIDGLATAYLEDSARYIARYSEAIGPYPFDGFSVVASPLPTGFGMPTLTYIGADVLKLPFIRATSLGHEVLHNWWGNGVLVDYRSGNWSEGLTTFMADLAFKEDTSPTAASAMRQGWLRDFAAVPVQDRQALAAFRSRTHGAAAAVGYGKSAMLFVMLRDLIGDDAFERGIRRFWSQQRFQVAGWHDLRAAFEQVSGRDLGPFFAQWLQRADAPAVRIDRARAHTDNGVARLTLDLVQSAPPYALSLPVALIYPDRIESRQITMNRRAQQLELLLDEMPTHVRLDPELRVWRQLDGAELAPILRQWVTASAPRLVIADAQAKPTDAFAAAARTLAHALLERAPHEGPAQEAWHGDAPVLLIGRSDAIDSTLAQAGLPPRPSPPGRQGSAQVWTVQGTHGAPLAVISAADENALRALQRPLPHYGAQSWLAFDGSRALDRGVWPSAAPAIAVEHD
ncbi:M1 family peptidase [Azoarcus sp. L1K30]|uniref:M1 family metallopeptidase n=1 Tax=Azoarcus sp. L1K30 TaxID=2820277 RepID=UPI001B8372C5|nr:M1 family aminopeptidase [Azoarcus sp. L1K30]MBR0568775.1 M1 family peptidase [Azoarcus sp. L1K30]